MPPRLCRIAAFAMAALPAASLSAAPPKPTIQTEAYGFKLKDGSELSAERGSFTVPEDRNDPKSRRIEIGFVRFRSTSPHPGAPIVYLAGGPGGSGVAAARGARQPLFLALRQVADVIALDQRGTGLSNHVPPCSAAKPLDPGLVLNEATLTAYYRETLNDCRTRWQAAGVAVAGYTTVQSADDIEDLRRALGATRLDLWAISYGTHLAMATMRRHPGSIGRVALSSAEGMDQTVKLPARVDAAFHRVDGAVGGGLLPLMQKVHAGFDSAPQTFTVPGADGKNLTFRADSFPLRMMAGGIAADPDGIPRLAGAYGALAGGQGAAVAPMLYDYFYRKPLVMTGMPELMDIASGISDARLALVGRQSGGSIVGRATNFPMPQLAKAVPNLDLGDRYRREIRSKHPVLLFSGDLDVRTPLEEQAAATAGLSNLQRVVVHNGGHNLFEAHPDVAGLLVAFFSGQRVRVRELSLPAPSLPADLRKALGGGTNSGAAQHGSSRSVAR